MPILKTYTNEGSVRKQIGDYDRNLPDPPSGLLNNKHDNKRYTSACVPEGLIGELSKKVVMMDNKKIRRVFYERVVVDNVYRDIITMPIISMIETVFIDLESNIPLTALCTFDPEFCGTYVNYGEDPIIDLLIDNARRF